VVDTWDDAEAGSKGRGRGAAASVARHGTICTHGQEPIGLKHESFLLSMEVRLLRNHEKRGTFVRMSQADLTLFETARPNGEANRIDPFDLPVHNWYRFVLSFPPHLVRDYIQRFDLDERSLLLDPFCGTGTTVVECQKMGLRAAGVEALPMPAFASRVKVDWSVDPELLLRHASEIAERAAHVLQEQGIADDPALCSSTSPTPLKTLPPDTFRLLLKDSISAVPLHKTLVLLDLIRDCTDNPFRDHELLALAKALVTSIGNLKFGPEVGIGKIKGDAFVTRPWLANARSMASDLRSIICEPWQQAAIYHADSRDLSAIFKPGSIDAVFTSPPYPNEKDYTRTTRLETIILGFADSMADLRHSKKSLVRSNTRSVYKTDTDDVLVKNNSTVQNLAGRIERRRLELGKTSGFERLYHRVTKLYFGGMTHHLASLRGVLRPGAFLGYVVGDQASYLQIMIRTGQILGEIAESLGYKVESLDLFRTRLATATGEQLREEVLVLRWPG
jgi:hypothetical protein